MTTVHTAMTINQMLRTFLVHFFCYSWCFHPKKVSNHLERFFPTMSVLLLAIFVGVCQPLIIMLCVRHAVVLFAY